jgi:hypothetical protein
MVCDGRNASFFVVARVFEESFWLTPKLRGLFDAPEKQRCLAGPDFTAIQVRMQALAAPASLGLSDATP